MSRGVEILHVERGSAGWESGMREGDILVSINGHRIYDGLSLTFWECGEELSIVFEREGMEYRVVLEKDEDDPLGIEVKEPPIRVCNNNCIFCFALQLPRGLRRTLYIKDDDLRLSFLYGAYITLTNFTDEDFERVKEERLSPLYVSVHSMVPEVRAFMFQNPRAGNIERDLERLLACDVEVHTQVVLCPGVNDGESLEYTIDRLASMYPGVKSLAIVPVGLTAHREGLYPLTPVDRDYAVSIIERLAPLQRDFRRRWDYTFLYLSDEWYLMSGIDLPDNLWYDDYPQIENGVGMARRFLDGVSELPPPPCGVPRVSVATGVLAFDLLNRLKDKMAQFGVEMNVFPVKNRLLGESVTVASLLGGRDIVSALRQEDLGGLLILPPNITNVDGLLIDDWRLCDIERELGVKVVEGPEDIMRIWDVVCSQ